MSEFILQTFVKSVLKSNIARSLDCIVISVEGGAATDFKHFPVPVTLF
jgi:hypothetical protein